MSTARVRDRAKERAGAITVLLIIGYGAGWRRVPRPQFQALFPELTRSTVDLFAHAIAAVNTVTIVTLSLGWYWIRNGGEETRGGDDDIVHTHPRVSRAVPAESCRRRNA